MKMTMCFPLLLLICSLCMAQLQAESDNEIISLQKESEPQSRETTNVSGHQQPCTQDIQAVLRQMSASLAEHGVHILDLKRENEAQAAKLRELDLQETEVDKLKQQLQAQMAELITMKAWANNAGSQLEVLKRNDAVKRVAFSASLLASGSGTVGPFNTHTPLVFKHVVSNIGNAYNPNTGFFIAPVRGAYHFEFYIGAHGQASHPSSAALVKNGAHIFLVYEHQTSHYGSSGNGATMLLEVGDVVFLRLWVNAIAFDNENRLSTFSGHLLFTM